MKRHVCKHCYLDRDKHCDYEEMEIPDACVCDMAEWDGRIDPICKSYISPTGEGDCYGCQHAKQCHANKQNLKGGKDDR